jgi:hypothetical protein
MATSRTRLPASLQPERKRRRWPSLLAILAVAVTGCAQAGTGTGSADAATASSSAATVTVGPDDGGRTVDLQVGDRLIVALHTGQRPPRFPPAWTLRMPPSKVLERVPGDPDAKRVVLVAEAPGTVRLALARRPGCAPPLRCPLAVAADPAGESGRTRPPLAGVTVAITVRVR